jgi:DNA-binding CsgD family transcriptional regulator
VLGPVTIGYGPDAAHLSAFRCAGGAFGIAEAGLVRTLAPQIERAIRLQSRARRGDSRLNPLAAAFDSLPTAVVLIGSGGAVLFANSEAGRVLGARDGLELTAAGLRAALPAENRELQRLLHAAAPLPASEPGVCLAVSRRSQQAPYLLWLLPTDPGRRSGTGATAMVFIVDPEERRAPAAQELIEASGLTPAQARLSSRLCRGEDLAAAANAEGISVATARVHLKAAFGKTGTRRQAELVGLLLRTCGSLPALPASAGAPAMPQRERCRGR